MAGAGTRRDWQLSRGTCCRACHSSANSAWSGMLMLSTMGTNSGPRWLCTEPGGLLAPFRMSLWGADVDSLSSSARTLELHRSFDEGAPLH